jgi:uroporphyrinogen-III synthase
MQGRVKFSRRSNLSLHTHECATARLSRAQVSVKNSPLRALQGLGFVVTRPADQAQALVSLLEGHGARALVFPAIEIRDVEDSTPFDALIHRLHTFDAAIFISPNAANKAMPAIFARRALPPAISILAIGAGTASALRRHGVNAVIVPPRYDSESLLDLPQLRDVEGMHIVIFRGVGGRALLGDALQTRGALVEYAECYRRVKPTGDVAPLNAAWARREIDGVIVTSSEGLRNFHEMLGTDGQAALAATPVFVPHPRIAATARELGLAAVVLTAQGDDAICAAIVQHYER